MPGTTPDKPRRRRAELPVGVNIEPVLLSPEHAAAMLGQISAGTLAKLAAAKGLRARQISPGRVGYLRTEIIALAEGLPVVTPGVQAFPDASPGA